MGHCPGPMRPLSKISNRRGGRLIPLVSVALVLVFLAPYGVGLVSQARGGTVPSTPAVVSSVTGSVLWNGATTSNHETVSSAISWSFSTVANVKFEWVGPLTQTGVSQAFLVILFLGFPAYTKQVVRTNALPVGSINMTYDLTQFKWYLQGIYELHAYLENPASNVLWSENFYVNVAQPYDLVVSVIGLLLLTIAELYMIATVGPRAMDKLNKQPKTPKSTTGGGTESTSDTSANPPEKS
jgi:hypothetical protein